MTIIEKTYQMLSQFGYQVYLQGSMGNDVPYPDNFFTYFIPDSEDNGHYDDLTVSVDWSVTVIFYSKDINTINSNIDVFVQTFKLAGFKLNGKGNLIASDEPDTVGYTFDLTYKENQ